MGIFYFLSKKKLSLKHRKYQKTEFTGEMGAREKLGLELGSCFKTVCILFAIT